MQTRSSGSTERAELSQGSSGHEHATEQCFFSWLLTHRGSTVEWLKLGGKKSGWSGRENTATQLLSATDGNNTLLQLTSKIHALLL